MQIDEGVDILCPDLKTINGSCYRRLYPSLPGSNCSGKIKIRKTGNVYEDEPSTCQVTQRDEQQMQDLKTAEIPTSSYFHKYLVGRGGVVKKRLENETGTEINVPKPYENKDFIKVKYRSEESLSSLEIRVNSIVDSARKRERPTHFICIPIYSDAISQNLQKFEDLITEKIHPHYVQNPNKLHLTITVLKLFSEKEIKQASDALNEFAPRIPYILCGRPLRGSLRNLEIMNDDPAAVRVLYSEVVLSDESDRLQNLADQCLEFFMERGLVDESDNHKTKDVKLHCTLINTRWNSEGPKTINVSEMLSKDWEMNKFGDFVLEKLELNNMGSQNWKDTARYANVSTIKLV